MTHLTFIDFLTEGYKLHHRTVHEPNENGELEPRTVTHVDHVDDGDDSHHVIQSALGKEDWHKNNVSKTLAVADQPIRKKPEPVNSKERHEMSGAHMQAYGNFHVYFGGVLRNGNRGQDEQKKDYQGVLSAIKEREGHTISPEAKQRLYLDAAREIVKQIRFETRMHGDDSRKESPLRQAAKVVLVPVPSSSKVPEEFAKVLAHALHNETRSVRVAKAGELVQANRHYDVYPDHMKVAARGAAQGERLSQKNILATYRAHLVKDVEEGRRTPAQAIKVLEGNKAHIESTIDKLDDEDGIAAYDHLDVIEQVIAEIKKTTPGAPNANVRRYAMMRPMDRRTHVYNRMKVPADKIGNTVDEDTVVVVVDDNIEEGSSIFQTYRALLKGGVVTSSHAVVGAVAHKLGTVPPAKKKDAKT